MTNPDLPTVIFYAVFVGVCAEYFREVWVITR